MTTLINGHGGALLSEDQRACVDLLREALQEAEAGNITTVGVGCCMKGGFATVMAGRQAGELNLAFDQMKLEILERVQGQDAPKQSARGSALRVR